MGAGLDNDPPETASHNALIKRTISYVPHPTSLERHGKKSLFNPYLLTNYTLGLSDWSQHIRHYKINALLVPDELIRDDPNVHITALLQWEKHNISSANKLLLNWL